MPRVKLLSCKTTTTHTHPQRTDLIAKASRKAAAPAALLPGSPSPCTGPLVEPPGLPPGAPRRETRVLPAFSPRARRDAGGLLQGPRAASRTPIPGPRHSLSARTTPGGGEGPRMWESGRAGASAGSCANATPGRGRPPAALPASPPGRPPETPRSRRTRGLLHSPAPRLSPAAPLQPAAAAAALAARRAHREPPAATRAPPGGL